MIRSEEIQVDQVGATRWVVAHHPASAYLAAAQELPPYASPELTTAWWDRLTATLNGECHRCGAVGDTPAVTETLAPGSVAAAPPRVRHRQGCACTDEAMDQLELECSPFGTIEEPDLSDETLEELGTWVAEFHQRRMADLAGQD
ncbi:hypothetical protein ABT255_42435 [Streptomyces mirabilis]|uniref:hypothetical protein n=1 Tax=Streptomyces mirabilis TaxID=68239 RepID=UPI0033341F38